MKLAILSDIHSNLEALQACYRRAQKLGAQRYVCLGDMIGYCADPIATLETVMALPGLIAVRGNHDEAALQGAYPRVKQSIQQAIRWTHDQLRAEHIDFISGLPYIATFNDAVFAHASVIQPEKWDYVHTPEQVKKCIQATDLPLIFLGHTHLPRLYYQSIGGQVKTLDHKEASPIPLYQQQRYVTNVGSVGQPRDGNSAASFVMYDTDSAEVTFYRVMYDFTQTAQKILAADLPPYFARRLARSDWKQ